MGFFKIVHFSSPNKLSRGGQGNFHEGGRGKIWSNIQFVLHFWPTFFKFVTKIFQFFLRCLKISSCLQIQRRSVFPFLGNSPWLSIMFIKKTNFLGKKHYKRSYLLKMTKNCLKHRQNHSQVMIQSQGGGGSVCVAETRN